MTPSGKLTRGTKQEANVDQPIYNFRLYGRGIMAARVVAFYFCKMPEGYNVS